MSKDRTRSGNLWETLRARLKEKGIDIDALWGELDFPAVKVVCVAPDLKQSVREMGEAIRDQVVMVRVDEQTSRALDAWVETGAVRSRSEAAALFIREGLKVRAHELGELEEALRAVEEARQRLRDKARNLFDGDDADRAEA